MGRVRKQPKQQPKQPDSVSLQTHSNRTILQDGAKSLKNFARLLKESSTQREDIIRWVAANRWLDGRPWSYESAGPLIHWGKHDVRSNKMYRPYLFAYIRDQCRKKSICKPRQAEMSVNQVNEHLYYALTRPHTRISHVFPVDWMGDEFSIEKIQSAIYESPNLIRRLVTPANVRRYIFDTRSFYYIAGALKKAGGRSGSRDIVTFDELDQIPDSIIAVYLELMSHSALHLERYLSTPTVPLVGIDAMVRQGSEQQWFWFCPKCKKEQQFEWPASLLGYFEPSSGGYDPDDPKYLKRLDEVYLGCRYCGTYADRNGEHYNSTATWRPERGHLVDSNSSWRIVGAMIPWKTGKDLLMKYHQLMRFPDKWYNEVWGIAHLKSGASLSLGEMRRCESTWQMPAVRTANMQHVSMGIDHGETQSWVLITADGFDKDTHKHCVIYIEEISEKTLRLHGFDKFSGLEHTRRMKQIIQHWQPEHVVSDAVGIGSDRTISLARSFPRIVYAGFFDTAETSRQLRQSKHITPQWSSEKKRTVTFSKVNTLKDLMNEIRSGRWLVPQCAGDNAETVDLFMRHCTALGIRPQYDDQTDREYEQVVRFQPADHLMCALMYSRIGWEGLVGMRRTDFPGII